MKIGGFASIAKKQDTYFATSSFAAILAGQLGARPLFHTLSTLVRAHQRAFRQHVVADALQNRVLGQARRYVHFGV